MITVTGDFEEPLAFLLKLQRRLFFFTPAMHGVAAHLESVARQSFSKQADPAGGGWEELRKSTQLYRARNGYRPNRPILVMTGDLKNSLKKAVTSHTAEVGSDLDYAAVHMTGRDSSENPMPARPYLGFAPGTEDAIAAAIVKHLSS